MRTFLKLNTALFVLNLNKIPKQTWKLITQLERHFSRFLSFLQTLTSARVTKEAVRTSASILTAAITASVPNHWYSARTTTRARVSRISLSSPSTVLWRINVPCSLFNDYISSYLIYPFYFVIWEKRMTVNPIRPGFFGVPGPGGIRKSESNDAIDMKLGG